MPITSNNKYPASFPRGGTVFTQLATTSNTNYTVTTGKTLVITGAVNKDAGGTTACVARINGAEVFKYGLFNTGTNANGFAMNTGLPLVVKSGQTITFSGSSGNGSDFIGYEIDQEVKG